MSIQPTVYRPRRLDAVVEHLLDAVPALMLLGPRAAGKTTTAGRLAASILRLDRPEVADAVAADPDAVLRGLDEPVLIDEWQMVPDVLGAVKRACDADPRPGRFLLTGSVRAETDVPMWPGTGRVVTKRLYGFHQVEMEATGAEPFVDRCFADDVGTVRSDLDLRDLVEIALRGGFPAAVDLAEPVRREWLRSYLDQLVARDLIVLRPRADRELLRRFVETAAIHTATVTDITATASAAGVSRHTAGEYAELLRAVHLLAPLPAWHSNRLKRLTRRVKQHLVEPALLGPAAVVDADTVLRDAVLCGRILESFVVAQLRAELEWASTQARMYHLRLEKGEHEADVVLEAGGRVVAIEVKAAARVSDRDARHLEWLRDRLGERFVLGVVLHGGGITRELSDRVLAVPVASIWR